MATLNLTSKEFADVAMVWLFDQVMNPEQVTNEDLKDFIEKHSSKLKTPLLKYYLGTDSEVRLRYRRIGGVFDGSDKSIQQIRIGPVEKIEKAKKGKNGIVKKIIKKVLKKEQISVTDIKQLKEMEDVYKEILNEILES